MSSRRLLVVLALQAAVMALSAQEDTEQELDGDF